MNTQKRFKIKNVRRLFISIMYLSIFAVYANAIAHYGTFKKNYSITDDGILLNTVIGILFVLAVFCWEFILRPSGNDIEIDTEHIIIEIGSFQGSFALFRLFTVIFIFNLSEISETTFIGAHFIGNMSVLLLIDLSYCLNNEILRHKITAVFCWCVFFLVVYFSNMNMDLMLYISWLLIGTGSLAIIFLIKKTIRLADELRETKVSPLVILLLNLSMNIFFGISFLLSNAIQFN